MSLRKTIAELALTIPLRAFATLREARFPLRNFARGARRIARKLPSGRFSCRPGFLDVLSSGQYKNLWQEYESI
jgi:hypothetical protein